MTVKKQKKINFVNDCEAIVDYKLKLPTPIRCD